MHKLTEYTTGLDLLDNAIKESAKNGPCYAVECGPVTIEVNGGVVFYGIGDKEVTASAAIAAVELSEVPLSLDTCEAEEALSQAVKLALANGLKFAASPRVTVSATGGVVRYHLTEQEITGSQALLVVGQARGNHD